MLNVSAKEFVPTASPKTAAAAKLPSTKDCAADSGRCCPTEGSRTTAMAVSGRPAGNCGAKAQLSPQAPEFVPRSISCGGGAAASAKSYLLDSAASDPPRSVLTPPRSDSTLSSSIESREADGCWGNGEKHGIEGQWYGAEEQPGFGGGMAYEATDGSGYCGYYYQGMNQQEQVVDQQGYDACGRGGYVVAATAVVQGGELTPGDGAPTCVHDPYGYSIYDGYVMPYSGVGADTLGTAVYYNVQYAYDATQQYEPYQEEAYYWDETVGAYVYGGAQYGADEYGSWQSPSPLLPYQPPQPACDRLPGPPAASAAWVSSAAPSEADGELGLGDEELRFLAPSDATELLEMFFPAYAGVALSRLLQRTDGDFLAAFAELAAMERHVGAERVAAGGSKYSRSKGGSGGKGPVAGGKATGSRRSVGGATTFKLDLESFPSLPLSPSPQPPAKTSPQAESSSTGVAIENGDQVPQEPSSASSGGSNLSTSTSPPAAATGPSASSSAPSAKPNFASMLRNSPSAPAVASSPTAQSSSSVAAASAGGCSSSDYRTTVKASSQGAAAAVPWVSTGEAVSAQYAEERREAAMLARARNQCFQQATLAYLSGNKALAKQLGRRGRELNDAMKAAHAAAARRIFAQRNGAVASAGNTHNKGSSNHHQHHQARRQQVRHQHVAARESAAAVDTCYGEGHHQGAQQQQQRQQHQQRSGGTAGGEAMFVDLHGLHVAEAVAVLETQIEAARAAGCRFLRVCTGAGTHTKTPARLPAAVADALLSNHLTFKTLKPGLLEAQL